MNFWGLNMQTFDRVKGLAGRESFSWLDWRWSKQVTLGSIDMKDCCHSLSSTCSAGNLQTLYYLNYMMSSVMILKFSSSFRRGSESLVWLHSGAPDCVRVDLPAAPSPSSSSALRTSPQLLWAPVASFLLILPPVSSPLIPGQQIPSPHDSPGIHITKHIVTCVCSQHTLVQNEENCMN